MIKLNKNPDGFTVVEVLLVLITLVVIGMAGFFVAKHIDKTTTETTVNTNTSYESLSQLINDIKIWIVKQYPSVNVRYYSPTSIKESNPYEVGYSVTGYLFKVNASSQITLIYSSISGPTPNSVGLTVRDLLVEKGFGHVNKPPVPPTNSGGAYYSRSNGDVCYEDGLTLSCVTVTDLLDVAKKAADFVAPYSSAVKINANSVLISSPNVSTNKAGTYQYAQVGTGDSLSYFYRKLGDSSWVYYTSSQQGISCSNITNQAAKLAFADICSNISP